MDGVAAGGVQAQQAQQTLQSEQAQQWTGIGELSRAGPQQGQGSGGFPTVVQEKRPGVHPQPQPEWQPAQQQAQVPQQQQQNEEEEEGQYLQPAVWQHKAVPSEGWGKGQGKTWEGGAEGRGGELSGQGIPSAVAPATPGHAPAPALLGPPTLLDLPHSVLAHILGRLDRAADLTRCGAACKALRSLVQGQAWGTVTLLDAQGGWAPRSERGLGWVAVSCPKIARVDLTGLGAWGAEALAALGPLQEVREMMLSDCWRIQGLADAELAAIQRPTLTLLDLSGTSALDGGVMLWRGLSTGLRELRLGSMRPGPTADLFPSLIRLDALTALDLSSNPWLLSTHLEQLLRLWDLNNMLLGVAPLHGAHQAQQGPLEGAQQGAGAGAGHAEPHPGPPQQGPQQQQQLLLGGVGAGVAPIAAGGPLPPGPPPQPLQAAPAPLPSRRQLLSDRWQSLRRVSFRNCGQLGGALGSFFLRHTGLTHVDLGGTSVSDAEVDLLAGACPHLESLDLSGCLRIKGPVLCTLARSPAVQEGHLRELRLGDLPWVNPQQLSLLLGAMSEWVSGLVKLDLSHCGGLTDTSLGQLLPWEDSHNHGRYRHSGPWGHGHGMASALAHAASRLLKMAGSHRGKNSSCSASGSVDGESHTRTPSSSLPGSPVRLSPSMGGVAEAAQAQGQVYGLVAHGQLSLEELLIAGSSRVSAGALLELATWGQGVVEGDEAEGSAAAAAAAHIAAAGETGGGGQQQQLQQAVPEQQAHCPWQSKAQAGRPTHGALLATLRLLDLSHCDAFRSSTSGSREALSAMLHAAGPTLRVLRMDGCHVGGGMLALVAEVGPGLEELSVVGCKGATTPDFCALSARLAGLQQLAVGGAPMTWREEAALPGFTSLTHLRIARRSFLSDAQLLPVVSAMPHLRHCALAGCPALSDAALEALPTGLRHLQLVCCERVTGTSLRQLRQLRSLRLSGCPAITEVAMQAAALACTQLTLLELPGHIRASCLPVAPPNSASHLRGIRVEGGIIGAPGGGGFRWRRRSRGGGGGRG